jgi:small subunit ribosomal protein S21
LLCRTALFLFLKFSRIKRTVILIKRKEGGINLEVKVFDNDVEKALKILKNKLSKSGLFKELKVRRAYEKPSVKQKRKTIEAQRRLAKVQRRRKF